jgi:hypothetical protein
MSAFIVTLILVTALIVFLKVKKFSPYREKLKQRIDMWVQKCHCDKFACKSSKKDKAEASAIKQPEIQEEQLAVAAAQEIDEVTAEDIAEYTMEHIAEGTVETGTVPCIEGAVIQSVPQDSILRRHFLTTLRAGIETRVGPRPSDSILRRHYDNLIDGEMKKRLPEEAGIDTYYATESGGETPNLDADVQAPIPAEIGMQPEVQTEFLAAAEGVAAPETVPWAEKIVKQRVPQDSILRRHFLTTLRAEIESSMCPRPTDSILQRHHDTLRDTEINKRLTEMEAD